MRLLIAIVIACALGLPAHAQQSKNFKVVESSFNAGGRPSEGNTAVSASFHVTLDSIGEALSGEAVVGPSYATDAGFVSAYPPPGEVVGLLFPDENTLTWGAERSAGDYNLYRDATDVLNGSYGTCEQFEIAGTTTTDMAAPPSQTVWFYLVTVRNRLGEEGTLGFDAAGVERLNGAPCP